MKTYHLSEPVFQEMMELIKDQPFQRVMAFLNKVQTITGQPAPQTAGDIPEVHIEAIPIKEEEKASDEAESKV